MRPTRLTMIALLLLSACTLPAAGGGAPATPLPPTDAPPLPTEAPTPTADEGPPVARFMALPRAYDFSANLCSATWSNSGTVIPCPGTDLSNSPEGYVALYDGAELNLKPGIPAILTYPAQSSYQALFGRFPPYKVRPGDHFYSHVDCLPRAICYVEFGLDYVDQQNRYHGSFASHPMHGEDPMEEFVVDLSPLAGQLIQFVLALRPVSTRESAYAVWIDPVILSYQTP